MRYFFNPSLHGSEIAILDVVTKSGYWRIAYSTTKGYGYDITISNYPAKPNLMAADEFKTIEPDEAKKVITFLMENYLSGENAIKADESSTYYSDAKSATCLTFKKKRWYPIFRAVKSEEMINISSGKLPYPRIKPEVPRECTIDEFDRKKWELITEAIDNLLDLVT